MSNLCGMIFFAIQGPQLGEVARLDTCVTVVDAADFHNNLDCIKDYENGESKRQELDRRHASTFLSIYYCLLTKKTFFMT